MTTKLPKDHVRAVQGSRTTSNTPAVSPGLFDPMSPRSTTSSGEDRFAAPFLHSTHLQAPKETHTVDIERDNITGNKLINDYEILDELGRGQHGKVKLGRHLNTDTRVAIKIVQRYSNRRRLGKLGNPEDKVKKEVAILKKARHPNVVALLEVIDDPNRQKVYIVLEYVELGEIVWRKKGLQEIILVERMRMQREKDGVKETPSLANRDLETVRRIQRARARGRLHPQRAPAWSLEHGAESDEDSADEMTSRVSSASDLSRQHTTGEDREATEDRDAIEGTMYGPYVEAETKRERSMSLASYQSSIHGGWDLEDDDLSFVPCLTMAQIRNALQDTVLGLEYLHYQGIIHRDIKPSNLLWTADHRVKISDFGVSYLGRPLRDDDDNDGSVPETDAAELDDARELSKTVGTPAFYAPELCFTDQTEQEILAAPKVTGQIDVWSLGVTLYGMVYGRLPFIAEDEFSMYKKIAKEDILISRKRLKAVDDYVLPRSTSQTRVPDVNDTAKRLDTDLLYEPVDDDLHDLIKRLLIKDPARRITLKEVKHHPWVLQGISDHIAWLDETDPSRQSQGKKIEVSNEEIQGAVAKIPFVERVRSGIKHIGKSFFGLSNKEKNKAAPSSTGSDSHLSSSGTSTVGKDSKDLRRQSLRGDEQIFTALRNSRDPSVEHHPLAQSVSASPIHGEDDDDSSYFRSNASSITNMPAFATTANTPLDSRRPQAPNRATSNADSLKTVRGLPVTSGHDLPRRPSATPGTLLDAIGSANIGGIFSGGGGRFRRALGSSDRNGSTNSSRASSRASSVERHGVSEDGHADASLALSTANASGRVNLPEALLDEPTVLDPTFRAPSAQRYHQPEESSAEDFGRAREQLARRQRLEMEEISRLPSSRRHSLASNQECPPSPDDEVFRRKLQEQDRENDQPGVQRSPSDLGPVMSSSSESRFGMSHSTSFPSVPSVVSHASSFSIIDEPMIPKRAVMAQPLMETADTIKTITPKDFEEDEAGYNGGEEEGEESDEEDEGLEIGASKRSKLLVEKGPSSTAE